MRFLEKKLKKNSLLKLCEWCGIDWRMLFEKLIVQSNSSDTFHVSILLSFVKCCFEICGILFSREVLSPMNYSRQKIYKTSSVASWNLLENNPLRGEFEKLCACKCVVNHWSFFDNTLSTIHKHHMKDFRYFPYLYPKWKEKIRDIELVSEFLTELFARIVTRFSVF